MDPSPRSFPILSYVMARLPSIGPTPDPVGSDLDFVDVNIDIDIEQPSALPSNSIYKPLSIPPPPPPPPPLPDHPSTSTSNPSLSLSSLSQNGILDQMPHLTDPKVLASMTRAVSEVAQTRSILRALGERPHHEAVDAAKAKLVEVEASLSERLQEIVLSPCPDDDDTSKWRARQAEMEKECWQLAEKEKQPYKMAIQLDEMHEAYQKLLKDAEQRLVKIYESAEAIAEGIEQDLPIVEEVNDEVIGILQESSGKGLERIDLSGRRLRFLPEAFGRVRGLLVLDISSNQLEVIPDSIAGLENLEEFHAPSNLLETLPDSIGLLHKLKILNVSGNKLIALPDSICNCKSLVELEASFNKLTYLPTNIGELVNLERLSIQLNKIPSLPSSIGEMKSLRFLDAHFNELEGLPIEFGKLTNLEVVNLSKNFADLQELPFTIGELINLRELDLSNNQLHTLPDTFGCLDSLVKLNLEQNPLSIPPMEIVNQGVEAVKVFMAKRWIKILVEEERKSMDEEQEQGQTGWLNRSTSWLKNYVSGVSDSVTDYLGSGGRSPRDTCLDQQL